MGRRASATKRPYIQYGAAELGRIAMEIDDVDELCRIIEELNGYRTTKLSQTVLDAVREARDRLEAEGEALDYESLPIDDLQPLATGGNRPYQDAAIAAALGALRAGRSAQIQLPTGAGKTRVGVDIALALRGSVLWIAPGWELLSQAARDSFVRRDCPELAAFPDHCPLMKDDVPLPNHELLVLDTVHDSPRICFSTPDSLALDQRIEEVIEALEPLLVIWDECHYGLTGKHSKRIRRALRNAGIPIIGLSATPKEHSEQHLGEVEFSADFRELVDAGYLSQPVVESRNTGIDWHPTLSGDFAGEVSQRSINELARNSQRNAVIVDELASGTYGKTLVFACTIEHADLLTTALDNAGVRSDVVHSKRSGDENGVALEGLRNGHLDVVVGVAKLSHGIDIPDLMTVALTRPTTSDILYAQMVGRGTRITATKKTFTILEFTDNVDQHHDKLYDTGRLFTGASTRSKPKPTSDQTKPAKRFMATKIRVPRGGKNALIAKTGMTRAEITAGVAACLPPKSKRVTDGSKTTFSLRSRRQVVQLTYFKAHIRGRIRACDEGWLWDELEAGGVEGLTSAGWYEHSWHIEDAVDLAEFVRCVTVEWGD